MIHDTDYDFRKKSRPSHDQESVGPMRFFKTSPPPYGQAYPASGIVYYAELLKNVTFSRILGSVITYSPTGHFEYIGSVNGSIPENSVVLCVKIGPRWWTSSVVQHGSAGFPDGVDCDPYHCVYPGEGLGSCSGLLPLSSQLQDYEVNFGAIDECGGVAGNGQLLKFVSDCEWRSGSFACSGGPTARMFWKLNILPSVALPAGGGTGQVILQLYDADTGLAVVPPVIYCINGGYPLWCANCDNEMDLCCGVGASSDTIGYLPRKICVKPTGGQGQSDCTACASAGKPQLNKEYLLSAGTIGSNTCCQSLSGSHVLTWDDASSQPVLQQCAWTSAWLGDCYIADGFSAYDMVWLLLPQGGSFSPASNVWQISAYLVRCLSNLETPPGHSICDAPTGGPPNFLSWLLGASVGYEVCRYYSANGAQTNPVTCTITGQYSLVFQNGAPPIPSGNCDVFPNTVQLSEVP